MDIEQKQEELIDHFVKQASSLTGSALSSVVADATSHPSLFAFSEILASLIFFSWKEQRMLCTWICFVCLHTAHGVITRSWRNYLHGWWDMVGDLSKASTSKEQMLK